MWKIVCFLFNNYQLVISSCSALAFFIVNIIQAIKNKDKRKLNDALLQLPQVIRDVETCIKGDAIQKKAAAESLCFARFGNVYRKNIKLFDDAIEDILNTPQKKGGSLDVSQKS